MFCAMSILKKTQLGMNAAFRVVGAHFVERCRASSFGMATFLFRAVRDGVVGLTHPERTFY